MTCLQREAFQNLKVNHSLNFVNPESSTHTQNIELGWGERVQSFRNTTGNEALFGLSLCVFYKKAYSNDTEGTQFRGIRRITYTLYL